MDIKSSISRMGDTPRKKSSPYEEKDSVPKTKAVMNKTTEITNFIFIFFIIKII